MLELDKLLILSGVIRLVFLDIPVFIVFLVELRRVKRILNSQNNSRNFLKHEISHKIAIALLIIIVTFTLLMYIDRILMNDIVMRVFFLWKDNG